MPARNALGDCPDCGAPLDHHDVLIEFERADGRPSVFADCPDCHTVVEPE